jgi:hypothetical protein
MNLVLQAKDKSAEELCGQLQGKDNELQATREQLQVGLAFEYMHSFIIVVMVGHTERTKTRRGAHSVKIRFAIDD